MRLKSCFSFLIVLSFVSQVIIEPHLDIQARLVGINPPFVARLKVERENKRTGENLLFFFFPFRQCDITIIRDTSLAPFLPLHCLAAPRSIPLSCAVLPSRITTLTMDRSFLDVGS